MNKENINLIFDWLASSDLDGFIISHDDEFMSEYLPPHNERLYWATGFSGSAGAAVILKEKAGIFVDGRYTVQVQQQVDKDSFDFLHLINNPYLDWIKKNVSNDAKIGFDPKLHSYQWYNSAKKTIKNCYSLIPVKDNPIDLNWLDREEREFSDILLLSEEYTGEHSTLKRNRISKTLKDNGCDYAIITRLDSIAWLLNIRGSDVPCNPVLLSYGILSNDGSFKLFIDNEIPDNFMNHAGENIEIYSMNTFKEKLSELAGNSILFDPFSNKWVANNLKNNNCKLVLHPDPCILPKACKNSIEINGMKKSHIRDGAAVCEFLSWLDNEMIHNHNLDESILSDKLETFREKKRKIQGIKFFYYICIRCKCSNVSL